VGPSNIVQVITDNACSCKAADAITELRYDHIFETWTICIVNGLNLVVKSIVGEVQLMKNICEEARDVHIFIANQPHAQAIYKEFARI
jgi:hypothetical protein